MFLVLLAWVVAVTCVYCGPGLWTLRAGPLSQPLWIPISTKYAAASFSLPTNSQLRGLWSQEKGWMVLPLAWHLTFSGLWSKWWWHWASYCSKSGPQGKCHWRVACLWILVQWATWSQGRGFLSDTARLITVYFALNSQIAAGVRYSGCQAIDWYNTTRQEIGCGRWHVLCTNAAAWHLPILPSSKPGRLGRGHVEVV